MDPVSPGKKSRFSIRTRIAWIQSKNGHNQKQIKFQNDKCTKTSHQLNVGALFPIADYM